MRELCLLAVALAFPGLLALQQRAEAQASAPKTTSFPKDRIIGYYTIFPKDGPVLKSFRETEESIARDEKTLPPQGGPLQGQIVYPADASIGLTLDPSDDATIVEKLRALATLDVRDVSFLLIGAPIDRAALEEIERFVNLRHLLITLDENTNADDLASCIARLPRLKYLNVSRQNDCDFGSTQFCQIARSLASLEYLSIPCEKLTDADVRILARNTNLDQVHLRSRKPVLGPASLTALKSLPNLRELWIVCTDAVTDLDVMAFTEVKSLRAISFVTSAHLTCRDTFKQRRPDCWFFLNKPSNELR